MIIETPQQLQGVFPAIFTPLLRDDPKRLRNSIDYAKAGKIIDDLIAVGVHGVVPVGTTGQSSTLTHKQHLDFIKFTIEHVNNRVPVIAGAGSNCTRESVEMIEQILRIAEVPMLCVTGYYNIPPREGISKHFLTLARETGAKIVVYNVPGRTSNYIHPDTMIELAEDSRIIGLKQAVDFKIGGAYREDTARIIKSTSRDKFSVLSGEDDSLYSLMELGGSGIISASANIPEAASLYVKIFELSRKGDWEGALQAQNNCRDFVEAVFIRKNPIPLGTFFNSPLYLPLVEVAETENGLETQERILKLIKNRATSLLKYHS